MSYFYMQRIQLFIEILYSIKSLFQLEMLEIIEFLVVNRVDLIICLLQKWFFDVIIHPKSVYNIICFFQYSKSNEN